MIRNAMIQVYFVIDIATLERFMLRVSVILITIASICCVCCISYQTENIFSQIEIIYIYISNGGITDVENYNDTSER